MKQARQALSQLRQGGDHPQARERVMKLGWESLSRTFGLLASVPLEAATDAVLTKQLGVQRYATALLVRLRRLARNEAQPTDDDGDEAD